MNLSPSEIVDNIDEGDDMQRRLRYQHSYGIILLVASLKGILDYKDMWFEQHEDILCQDKDGKYVYYQVKTREETQGSWVLNDEALWKSISRFAKLEKKFGNVSKGYYFVSNCSYKKARESSKIETKEVCPINFFEAVNQAESLSLLNDEYKPMFQKLLLLSKCNDKLLFFNTLKKIGLIKGPTLDAFEVEVSCDHLANLEECKDFGLPKIHKLRDELVNDISKASSLLISNSVKHFYNLLKQGKGNPRISSKKYCVEDLRLRLNSLHNHAFDFLQGSSKLKIGEGKGNSNVLYQKLLKAGLENQFDSLERRGLSTEYKFLELTSKEGVADLNRILDQVEGVIITICSDALLENTNSNNIDGVSAMKSAQQKIREEVVKNPDNVRNLPFDSLMGILSLLTGECHLWWSEKFKLEKIK
jgi:hypothetical protein